jgi:16S rRNA (adenine1518-N6/adenine1519-N6)-dimethyltransferase
VPEVDSAVIRITPSPPAPLPILGEGGRKPGEGEAKKFFRIVRAGFSAKRKTLVNNLASGFHLDKKEVEEKLKKVGISLTARAQELSIDDWKKLLELFSK